MEVFACATGVLRMEENMNPDHGRLQSIRDFKVVGADDDDEISPVEQELDPAPRSEGINLDLKLGQYEIRDSEGVGAQHDDDEISPVEQVLDSAPLPEGINLDLKLGQYEFWDSEGAGAQHEDDEISPAEQKLDPEGMNLDLQLGQYDFRDFMGVGAQHDDDEISPAEQKLDPAPRPEGMSLDLKLGEYEFIDFMGVGAQHGDDEISPVEQELDPAPRPEIMNQLVRGSQYRFIDFMGVGEQHGNDVDIDDLSPQRDDSTCSDDALLEADRKYTLLELFPPGRVERDTPENRPVRLDLDLRLLPGGSMRLLREQEDPHFLTLRCGPTSDPA